MARVVVVGSLNIDLVTHTERIPAPGETVLGGDLATVPGGKGANQAVAAARLGAQTAMVGQSGRRWFCGSTAPELGRRQHRCPARHDCGCGDRRGADRGGRPRTEQYRRGVRGQHARDARRCRRRSRDDCQRRRAAASIGDSAGERQACGRDRPRKRRHRHPQPGSCPAPARRSVGTGRHPGPQRVRDRHADRPARRERSGSGDGGQGARATSASQR